ncbi:MAG: hypothetical protein P0S96_05400 [Simkaniaceae bacterium]|nr:hypothetical protein [Candidatus Sacchlamyda saccharinae]
MDSCVDESLEMANLVVDKREKSYVLMSIAEQVAKCTEEFDRALEIALSVPEEEELATSLNRVAYSFLDRGDLQRTLEAVLLIPKFPDKYYGLIEISIALKDEDSKKKFNVMIVECLLKDLEKISDRSVADQCIDSVAKSLIHQEDFEQGLKLSELYYDLSKKDNLYYDAVSKYSSKEDYDKATKLANKISDKRTRDNSFSAISQDMIYRMKPVEKTADSKMDEAGFLEFSEVALKENVLQS